MKWACFFAFIAILLLQSAICYLKPFHNWDMLAYMGCALSIEEPSIDSLHALTYSAAKKELPAESFQTLTTSTDYRRKNFEDVGFFYSRLELYQVKPLYVGIVFLFNKAGFSLPLSTLLPSLLFLLITGILLYGWLQKYLTPLMTLLLSSLIMLSPPFWEAGRYSTPDGMGAAFVFAAFYFLLEKREVMTSMIFLLLAVFVRIDLSLLALMVTVFLRLIPNAELRVSNFQLIIYSTLFIVSTLLISLWAGNFGNNLNDYYNLSEATENTGSNYLRKLAEFIPQLRYSSVTLFIVLFVISSLKQWKSRSRMTVPFLFGLLMIAYIAVRFLIFPSLENRFFIAQYLILAVISVMLLREQASGKTSFHP